MRPLGAQYSWQNQALLPEQMPQSIHFQGGGKTQRESHHKDCCPKKSTLRSSHCSSQPPAGDPADRFCSPCSLIWLPLGTFLGACGGASTTRLVLLLLLWFFLAMPFLFLDFLNLPRQLTTVPVHSEQLRMLDDLGRVPSPLYVMQQKLGGSCWVWGALPQWLSSSTTNRQIKVPSGGWGCSKMECGELSASCVRLGGQRSTTMHQD